MDDDDDDDDTVYVVVLCQRIFLPGTFTPAVILTALASYVSNSTFVVSLYINSWNLFSACFVLRDIFVLCHSHIY